MTVLTSLRLTAALGVLLLVWPALAKSQLPPGKECYVFPPGGPAGRTIDVRLGGTDWTPDVQFFVLDKRVKLELLGKPSEVMIHEPPYWVEIKSFANDPRLPREVNARFHLPADLPPGPIRWVAVTANGAGGGGLFDVGNGAELIEDEERTAPQEITTLPVTVNGRLRRIEEVDRYQFRAPSSGLVTCDLAARRLGNDFHAVIEVDEGQKRISEVFGTDGIDPVLTFAVTKGKHYTIAIRDVDHRGYRNFTYRIKLRNGPRVVTAYPPAGRRGETRPIEFVGIGIVTGQAKLERLTKDVRFPNEKTVDSFIYHLETPHGQAAPFNFTLADTDEQLEPATERKTPKFVIPGALTGRIRERGERNTYTVTGKKGEQWSITVQARKIGSSLDATLTVLGPDGKPLTVKDDARGSADPRVLLTFPADGEYQLEVGDVSGKAPGLDAVYRIVMERPVAGFSFHTVGIVNIPIGGNAKLTVDLIRDGNFVGPVTLTIAGLPDGVTAPKELVIPEKTATLVIELSCAMTAGAAATRVKIVGTATVGDSLRTVVATSANGDHLVPRILVATTMKPPFQVKAAEADGGRRVPRGSTHLAEVLIERTDNFTGEIVLDMAGNQQRHRQGIRGPALTVAPTQNTVAYPVFLPEGLETTRTSRIGLVAMAKVADPKGTPRWVMDAMQGQITMSIEGALMKLSQTPNELSAVYGESIDVSLKLARSPHLKGTVTVELIVPSKFRGLISSKPIEWPANRESSTLHLLSKDDPQLVGVWKLLVRATGTRDGHPVVSETEIEVEFTRPLKLQPLDNGTISEHR